MPSYSENIDSQLPALSLLQKLGWQYITPGDTIRQRHNIKSNVLLEDILEHQLRNINGFQYRNTTFKFSDGNIHAAIYALKNLADEGLVRTSEKVFDLLTLGKSFEETIRGDKKSFTIKYIDWLNPENNLYHVTDEYVVDGLRGPRRTDLVLFINGIPFAALECKRRDQGFTLDEAISQHLRNQSKETGVPKLYHYTQLLLAVQPNEVKYATIDAKPRYWQVWEEQENVESEVQRLLQQSLPGNNTKAENRLPTTQDKMLYCLCRPQRVLELTYQFIVYDGLVKKICRYPQYFAVKNTVKRVKEYNSDGQRRGGTIWHTQGSGKSLTMVMLAKSLALDTEIPNARIIIVTDRIDLDRQITKTFEACQIQPIQAKNGNHLMELVEDNGVEVITTVIDKFDSAISRKEIKNTSPNIFVLVDESHRSQYGLTHAKMRKVLPMACYLGFTGTPLTHAEKSTARKFGGFIQPTYPIEKAVKDKAVVPLLYEGRSAKLSVNKPMIDKGFNRLSESLTTYQAKDLKRKFASITELYRSQQVVDEIGHDVAAHYRTNWKGQGFKAILAAPRKETALRYLRYFEQEMVEEQQRINARVVISAPDTREDFEEVDEEPNSEVQKWWAKEVAIFPGGPEEYEKQVIAKFNNEDEEVELLIVVGKLLTGFDAPRCTILYLAKPLKEHNLLQAIARVNRLHEGKDFGHIIDYIGILGELDEALTSYAVLHQFEEADLHGTLLTAASEISKLPAYHSYLTDIFKEVKNKKDKEELERFLAPKDRRDLFVEKLTDFGRCLQTSLSSDDIFKIFTEERIRFFRNEFKFYHSLRTAVQQRYAEKIDYKEYEKRVRKLLDTYIGVEEIERLVDPVNIFNEAAFKSQVEKMTGSAASKADAMAHAMKKVTSQRMDEDPVFYKRFSDLIDEVIQDFHRKRISEIEYSNRVNNIADKFRKGETDGTPTGLQSKPEARAFYGIIKKTLQDNGFSLNDKTDNILAQAADDIEKIISRLVIRDWKRNDDVHKIMQSEVEDYLQAESKNWNIYLTWDDIDGIWDGLLKVAKSHY